MRSKPKNNKSGHSGVHFETRTGKWIAYINYKGDRTYLGRFDNKADAVFERRIAERLIEERIIRDRAMRLSGDLNLEVCSDVGQ